MEILFRNVKILDGSGEAAYTGSVGVESGRIRLLAANCEENADKIIDGAGLTLLPGFIDAHAHGDLTMLAPHATASKLTQGITTQIAGQCGVSMFPYNEKHGDEFPRFIAGISPHSDFPADMNVCKSADRFLRWLTETKNPIRTLCFTGHGSLRLFAMDYDDRPPTKKELDLMCGLLRESLQAGSVGLSTGLVYAPSCYADNDEIRALLKDVAKAGGYYATHPRNESDTAIEARRESIELAEEAGVPLAMSHLKAAGQDNWGKVDKVLELVDAAGSRGMRILVDSYPYLAGSTSLNVSIPPRYFTHGLDGLVAALQNPIEREKIRHEIGERSDYDNYVRSSGGFSGLFVSSCPVFHDAEGMFITEYAEKTKREPFDAYCEILIKNQGLGLGVYFHMSERDVLTVLSYPRTAIGTDGLVGLPNENPHPRAFGTMPHAYRFLTKEHPVLSPEAAVRKMTGLPASFYQLKDVGLIKEGYCADLLLIDESRFTDTATYHNGSSVCEGILGVYAGGKLVVSEGQLI